MQLPTNLATALEERIQACPQGRYWQYHLGGEHRSAGYAQLWDDAGRIALGMRRAGCARGATVALLLDGVLELVAGVWACWRGGFVAAPISSLGRTVLRSRRSDSLIGVLERLRPALVVADDRFEPIREGLPRMGSRFRHIGDLRGTAGGLPQVGDADPDDWACVLPSSGTTEDLKLVALPHAALIDRLFSRSSAQGGQGRRVGLGWFSLDSVTGLHCVSARFSEYVYLATESALASPLALFDAVERFRVGYLPLTSYLARRIDSAAARSDARWDLSSLERVGVGGETVVPQVMRSFAELLARHGAPEGIIFPGYGMTETGLIAGGETPMEFSDTEPPSARPSLGPPVPGVSIRIVDDEDRVLDEGRQGHVQIRAPTRMFAGYVGRPDRTATSFTADGWFRSGDLGFLAEGCLSVTDRAKDVVIINAKNYSLVDMETLLQGLLAGEVVELTACTIRRPADATESLAVFFEPIDQTPLRVGDTVRRIRRGLARDPGVPVRDVVAVWPDQIPRTAAGKVRRSLLGERFTRGELRCLAADVGPGWIDKRAGTRAQSAAERVTRIWSEALGCAGDPSNEDDFFACGGNSLAAAELFGRIEAELGLRIPVEAFFARPLLGTLLDRLRTITPARRERAIETGSHWPMPTEIYRKLLPYVAAWPGERRKVGSLVSMLNPRGADLPLAWVCQSGEEFSQLARHLGAGTPVFGMRSGSEVMDYSEDEVQAFALHYAREIEDLYPEGPLFVGGNCQGAVIALAVAQHLLRRRRHIPLLVLMEWSFLPQPYGERVLLLFGRDSQAAYPWLRYRRPELAWTRSFPDYQVGFIQGAHGRFFQDGNIGSLADVLRVHMRSALRDAPRFLPGNAYRVAWQVDGAPNRAAAGMPLSIRVGVRNTSPQAWPAFPASGLMVAARWLDANGDVLTWRDGGAPLPALAPNGQAWIRLDVTAPAGRGPVRLLIDLVEEGSTWFERRGNPVAEVALELREPVWTESIRSRAWSPARWAGSGIRRILTAVETRIRHLGAPRDTG